MSTISSASSQIQSSLLYSLNRPQRAPRLVAQDVPTPDDFLSVTHSDPLTPTPGGSPAASTNLSAVQSAIQDVVTAANSLARGTGSLADLMAAIARAAGAKAKEAGNGPLLGPPGTGPTDETANAATNSPSTLAQSAAPAVTPATTTTAAAAAAPKTVSTTYRPVPQPAAQTAASTDNTSSNPVLRLGIIDPRLLTGSLFDIAG